MDLVFENISSLVVFTILFLIVYAALLNIYFIHKNGFRIGVNCWFCNRNSKVLYSKRNNFECRFCLQYNGFNKDGDYNKVIEAQHNASLNAFDVIPNQKTGYSTSKSSNGLCNTCNRNQQLRVIQLANYEPLDERNYDKEIKHFEEQLEKTYGLCKKCSKLVKNTVRKQNAWIFGNKIKSSFLSKSSKATQGSQGAIKLYHRLSVIRLILLILSLFNLGVFCGLNAFITTYVLPEGVLSNNVILSDLYSSIYNFSASCFGAKNIRMYLPRTLKIQESSSFPISMLGFSIELLFNYTETNSTFFSKVNKICSWIIIGLLASIHFKIEVLLYFRTLEVFCSLYLIYMYSSTCIENKQRQKFNLKRIKRQLKSEEYSDNEESDSDSPNNSRSSYKTAVNKHSPITASSFSNLNRSFESVRSRKSTLNNTLINNDLESVISRKFTLNNTLINNDLRTAKHVELNKHFNELNIGALSSNMSRDYQSPASPNPFLNQSNRPQSPTSTYCSTFNRANSPFLNQSQYTSPFILQSSKQNSNLSNGFNSSFTANQPAQCFNQSRSVSPMSVRTEPIFPKNQSFSVASSSYNQGLNLQSQTSPTSFLLKNNYHSGSFSPRDTSSVISQNITSPRSPVYNLRSSTRPNLASPTIQETLLNNSFRPVSSSNTLERPTRSLLSPSKLNNINTFYSDKRGNGSLSMSFHTENQKNSGLWSHLNGSNLHQRFVVNSLSNIQCTSPLNSTFVNENVENNKLSNSRSSSTSSGFASNGDYAKGISRSLPNSRENSPERCSLLSEPIYF